jgi:hypothetical protein
MNNKFVTFVEDSKNEKTGPVAATYASIKATCPSTCQLKDEGCYAQTGNVGMHLRRLDNNADGVSPLEAAIEEAKLIKASFKGKVLPYPKNLRLHVSGDTTTKQGAKVLSEAVDDYKNRKGGLVWSYTHAWRTVPRSAWTKNISILGSVDSVDEIKKVRRKGYAPAIVVPYFENHKAFSMKGTATKFIPCPAQTKENVTCVDCKLCMRADDLHERNYGIAFASHGVRKNTINKRLTVIK